MELTNLESTSMELTNLESTSMELTNQEQTLFDEISAWVEQSRRMIYSQANSMTVLLFWQIGRRINDEILCNNRAGYGKQIVVTLSSQLSWSPCIALLSLKTHEAKMFYAQEAANGLLGVRDLRKLISRKAFERKEIADTQITPISPVPLGMFYERKLAYYSGSYFISENEIFTFEKKH